LNGQGKSGENIFFGKVRENEKLVPPDVIFSGIRFGFRWGSALDPTGGSYSASPDPLAALNIAP